MPVGDTPSEGLEGYELGKGRETTEAGEAKGVPLNPDPSFCPCVSFLEPKWVAKQKLMSCRSGG